MKVRLQDKSHKCARGSASLDDELDRIRRRMEKTRTNAIQVLEGLRRFLAEEGQPETQQDFERFGIRLQLASEAMQEAAGETK